MTAMARLLDVARKAGVSVSVVSRVLREEANLRVRPETREAVLVAARELDYHPNHTARALRLRISGVIGLFVPDVNDAIFSEVLRGVETEAMADDLLVFLGRSDGLDQPEHFARRIRNQGRIDGAIIQTRDELSVAWVTRAFPLGTPAVFINSHDKGPLSSVALDDALAARTAVEFLLAHGHRRIGLIGGLDQTSTARAREKGYRAALCDVGSRPRREWIFHEGYTPDAGNKAMRQLLRLSDRPSAVVVANANAAVGVLSAAREARVEVPAEMSVIAIHNVWMADYTEPPLTTVRVPTYELGLKGAQVLLRSMRGGGVEHLVIRSPSPAVVPRGSHGFVPVR